MICRICHNTQRNSIVLAREMMFGLRTKFEYIECGCLQIKEYPRDASQYYPESYYSVELSKSKTLFERLKSIRNTYSLRPKGMLGSLVNRYVPENRYQSLRFLENPDQSILDVGCGSGEMLRFLHEKGFTDLTGIDPFIDQNIFYSDHLKIYKKSIHEMDGRFDFIMMHHAFEHMEEPEKVLHKLHSLLSEKGVVLIRIPLAGCHAFKKYKENWVQLDAPRHLYLHTPRSMEILCKRARLKIFNIIFDSQPFQFWGSEMYKNNTPLVVNAGILSRAWKILRYRVGKGYRSKSRKLNAEHQGDQAAFYIQKLNDKK